ncbi:MAG TPA: M20/M25/M40 family metallo-hydrolase [Ideonella sp.]|uniref:M20/M25/M40 family metallo-hydrolase n=1 Tax=Ideonella sp. TaxID=1929293 RepID=UPI002CB1EB1C|nr:M20/M25/M40 family metallo-hydrolase [Ideonella sp.]HSI52264.1 M20/M25/M40 family metallo-hydrolase [Ideonella sp.]
MLRFVSPALRLTHLAAALMLATPLLATTAQAAPAAATAQSQTWITLGEQAFGLLRKIDPDVRSQAQREWIMQTPKPGSHSAALQESRELVHVVHIDNALLPALSEAIHTDTHRCAGFVAHASRAEAFSALNSQQEAQSLARQVVVPSYTIDNQDQVAPMITQVQDSQILSTIQTLSDFQNRYYTSTYGVAASDKIMAMWKALAGTRSDITVEQFTHAGWPQKSVILTIKGTAKPKEIVVMGAHLDSIVSGKVTNETRAPGADDDASGIATLTEVLRVMVANNYKPRRTIQFMGYAAEEEGLLGSAEIAKSYKRQLKKVVGVLQLDMTNYQGSAKDIYIYTDYTNGAQNTFLANLASTYLPTLTVGYDKCGYGCSDHASWYGKGYAASLPFEAAFTDDNPYIHSANDTLANMGNQASDAAKFAKLTLAFGVELGTDGPTVKP